MANNDSINPQYGIPITFKVEKDFFFRNIGKGEDPKPYFTWLVQIKHEGQFKSVRLNLNQYPHDKLMETGICAGGVATISKSKIGTETRWEITLKSKGGGGAMREYEKRGGGGGGGNRRGSGGGGGHSSGGSDFSSDSPVSMDAPGLYLECLSETCGIIQSPIFAKVLHSLRESWENADPALPISFEQLLDKALSTSTSLFIEKGKKGITSPSNPIFSLSEPSAPTGAKEVDSSGDDDFGSSDNQAQGENDGFEDDEW